LRKTLNSPERNVARMVEQNKSGSYAEIVYDALGNKLALMNGTSTLKEAFAPLPRFLPQ